MEVGSKVSPAGNAVNSCIVNQHQETVNAKSEMLAVAEQATKLKSLKIAENEDRKKTATVKIAENKDRKKTATVKIAENKDRKKTANAKIAKNKDGNKTTAAKIAENKDRKKTTTAMMKENKKKVHKNSKNKAGKVEHSQACIDLLTALYLLDNPNGSSKDEIMNFMIYEHIMHGSFQAFFDDIFRGKDTKISKNSNQKKELKTVENKDDKKTTKAMKKANKKMARKSGKKEFSQEYIDVLTAVYHLDNPNGSSLDEIADFMISEHVKHGSFQAIFDAFQGNNSKNANQIKELRILENKDSKKTTAAMKKGNKTKLHKSSKNKVGEKELSKMELEILTPIQLPDNVDGLSEAEIMDFMITQYIQHGSFPAFFDSIRLNVKDNVNRGTSTKPDGK